MSQTRFFKATRPDGTDFYTGEVDYAAALASGQPLPELPGGEFPGTGWYHVGVQSTSCVGMSWPCRLFVVEPVGPVEHVGKEKAGCRSLRVVEERPAHEVFGPQGVQVVELLTRCASLSRILAAPHAARNAARDAAFHAAWGAAWEAALNAAWDAARDAAWDAALNAVWDAAWDASLNAALNAVCALLVRDLIGEKHYVALTGTWASIIGPVHPDDKPVTT